jgi:hypothetical protein
MSLHTRLTRLESREPTSTAYVWKDFGQSEAEAIAAWRVAHPGIEPGEFLILRWKDPQEGRSK